MSYKIFIFFLFWSAGRKSEQQENVEAVLNNIEGHDVKFMELDLSDLDSVKLFLESFKSLNLPLHLLINNGMLISFDFF